MAVREFVGKDWFGWLLKEKIPFHIRIKNNTMTTNAKGLQVDIDALFYGLKPNEQRSLKSRRFVWGHLVYLAGLRLVMEEKQYYVYILSSKKYGTLYTGITSNLVQRIWQHQQGLAEGFTKKYKIHHLVYDEIHSDVYEAITREKRIKKWNRQWKINLIEQKKTSGLICASDYADGWLPACAGMTSFFVMYRGKFY